MPYSNKPLKKYGPLEMNHGLKMMGKPLMMKVPALLAKCGMGRYGKKK